MDLRYGLDGRHGTHLRGTVRTRAPVVAVIAWNNSRKIRLPTEKKTRTHTSESLPQKHSHRIESKARGACRLETENGCFSSIGCCSPSGARPQKHQQGFKFKAKVGPAGATPQNTSNPSRGRGKERNDLSRASSVLRPLTWHPIWYLVKTIPHYSRVVGKKNWVKLSLKRVILEPGYGPVS